jgi:DNA-binding transcriptional ArsR family regulator
MDTDYSAVARLLASPARSTVVNVLMTGRPMAAGELARLAGISASTMSGHLGELVSGGLVTVITVGRHRYYRLANAEVASALEALSMICPVVPVRSLSQASGQRSLRTARFCYDHLAGAVGVALLTRLRALGWLAATEGTGSVAGQDFEVTATGEPALAEIGIDLESCRRMRRHFARSCLDWTEREGHLAGALGAAMAAALADQGWLTPQRVGRGLAVTSHGERRLQAVFGISGGDLESSPPPGEGQAHAKAGRAPNLP